MAHHQNVQQKVQNEIYLNIGDEREISYAIRLKLPYVESVLQEVLRLATTSPAPNRQTVRDFELGHYKVRAGTILTMNLYGIFRDPRVWTDPTHFNPDANFPLDGSKRNAVEHFLPFGIGKRVCLGETLARQELFLFFVGLMHAFTVEADPSAPLPPGDIGTPGISRGPLPFKVQFIPRNTLLVWATG